MTGYFLRRIPFYFCHLDGKIFHNAYVDNYHFIFDNPNKLQNYSMDIGDL